MPLGLLPVAANVLGVPSGVIFVTVSDMRFAV